MVIARKLVDEIIAHSRQEFPNEACGLLASRDGTAIAVYPIDNADASPVHYRMEPQQQLRAMLEIDDNGWDLGAVYHSHTHTRAYPSQTDVGLAFYPDSLYVIVSLAFDQPEVRGFSIIDGDIHEETIEIVEP